MTPNLETINLKKSMHCLHNNQNFCMEKLPYTKSKSKEQTGKIFAIQMTKASGFLVYQEEKDQQCRRKKNYFNSIICSFSKYLFNTYVPYTILSDGNVATNKQTYIHNIKMRRFNTSWGK